MTARSGLTCLLCISFATQFAVMRLCSSPPQRPRSSAAQRPGVERALSAACHCAGGLQRTARRGRPSPERTRLISRVLPSREAVA
jgi:hypothetical protein